jgi:hypothetical protein
MIQSELTPIQQINNRPTQKYNLPIQQTVQTKTYPPPMQFAGVPPRKIVGQRTQMPANNPYRNNSMFNNGFASPPPSSSSSSSSGSTIVRPTNNNSNFNIPDKSNFFQAFSSMSIAGGNHDQDIEYNPFQSKISFDNNMWGNNSQQPIPWQ